MLEYYSLQKPIMAIPPTAVALGYFDGVHLGHRAVLSAAVDFATKNNISCAAFTFSINKINTKGNMLLTHSQRLARIADMGFGHYVCPSFDSFCKFSANEFVEKILVGFLNAKSVFCGTDYKFGKNATGNFELLKQLCKPYGISVFCVPTALYQNDTVSSTRIKKALQNGDISDVNAMLCNPYAIDLPVLHGAGFGRTMGFPTINQIYPDFMVLPKQGVYITQTIVDGTSYPSATGIGTRPTVNGDNITCETFIDGYEGDLYQSTPTVQFYSFLAETQQFENIQTLKEKICEYATASKSFFAKTAR